MPHLSLKTSLLAVFVFSLSLSFAPHAFAGTGLSPSNYSYLGGATYNGTGQTIGLPDYYPLYAPNNQQSLLSAIHRAEKDCKDGGFQACNFSVNYRSAPLECEGNPGPCFIMNASGISASQQTPVAKGNSGPGNDYTVYYAVTDITATLSANPTSVTSGQSSTLHWTSQNEGWGTVQCSIDNGIGNVSPASSGSVSTGPLSATKTFTLTCGDGAPDDPDQITATATVTVTPALMPDLIASAVAVSPNPPTAGTPATLSATIKNQGTAATGGSGFTDLYEMTTDPNHVTIDATVTDSSPTLGIGSTDSSQAAYTFPTSGTWYVRACADKRDQNDVAGVVAESNEDNNCSDGTADVWTQITVNPAPQPDLTATYGSPTNADDSQQVTLAGTIENPGNASTGSGTFVNEFEINPNSIPPDFASVYALRSASAGPLPANGHQDVTALYTFKASLGSTWYVRLCADTNTNNQGTVDEGSNEDNNCSAWTAVTITTQTLSCSANPSEVAQGASQVVTFTASPTTLSPYTWTPQNSNLVCGSDTDKNVNCTLSASAPVGQYDMKVKAGGQNATCHVTVTANGSCSEDPSGTLTANPTRVNPNDAAHNTSVLSWSNVQGVAAGSSCGIQSTPLGNSGGNFTANTSCNLVDGNWTSGAIKTQTQFCLYCGGVPVDGACAVVDVVPGIKEF